MLDVFRSEYLLEQAHKYHVPLPAKEDDWIQSHFASADERYLTAATAQKLRADIRAEQKADWDHWANKVTLALALIGSIFGVLAFFKNKPACPGQRRPLREGFVEELLTLAQRLYARRRWMRSTFSYELLGCKLGF
jgi:hypothetical protein